MSPQRFTNEQLIQLRRKLVVPEYRLFHIVRAVQLGQGPRELKRHNLSSLIAKKCRRGSTFLISEEGGLIGRSRPFKLELTWMVPWVVLHFFNWIGGNRSAGKLGKPIYSSRSSFAELSDEGQ